MAQDLLFPAMRANDTRKKGDAMLEALRRLFGPFEGAAPTAAFWKGLRSESLRGSTYLGIDLGTTTSLAALADPAKAVESRRDPVRLVGVDPIDGDPDHASPFLYSAVARSSGGETLVGERARRESSGRLVHGRNLFVSTKNSMGLAGEPYWPKAVSPDLDSPWKIAAHVLETLMSAVRREAGDGLAPRAVLTVPASFGPAARSDTLRATKKAGLDIDERSLLDEPNAAFLDWLLTVAPNGGSGIDLSSKKLVAVVDFGGGTCDVSILRVEADFGARRLDIRNLSISRFERLGGDDIDRALVESVLLPKLLAANGLKSLDFGWAEKNRYIVPQLQVIAEKLKVMMVDEIRDRPNCAGKTEVRVPSATVSLPFSDPLAPGLRELVFGEPGLTRSELDSIVDRFADPDLLYPKESELGRRLSVFSPVNDALHRARLSASQIDAFLMAGGSTFLPQIESALEKFFPLARKLRFPDAARTMSAVARGAALHSLLLHGLGRPLLEPIVPETISLLTAGDRLVPLIAAGSTLPAPANGGYAVFDRLVVPPEGGGAIEIVVCGESPSKVLATGRISTPDGAHPGETIEVLFKLDTNKVFQLDARLPSQDGARCEVRIENPLSSICVESRRAQQILELEKSLLADGAEPGGDCGDFWSMQALSHNLYKSGRNERAIEWARTALRVLGGPNGPCLATITQSYLCLGAYDRAERSAREELDFEPNNWAPAFNLALALESQDRFEEALETIDLAARLNSGDPASLARRALILRELGRTREADEARRISIERLDVLPRLEPHQRYLRRLFATELGDSATAARLGREAMDDDRPLLTYDPGRLPVLVEAEHSALTTGERLPNKTMPTTPLLPALSSGG